MDTGAKTFWDSQKRDENSMKNIQMSIFFPMGQFFGKRIK
jgi:hypothetical protein